MVCVGKREAPRMPLELLDRPTISTIFASGGPPGRPEPVEAPEGDEEDEDAK
jgi:hypothetical protein